MSALEKLLWSIALPGFGQFLNKQYVKGIVFVILEILVNVRSNLNEVIMFSFHGNIQHALDSTDFAWLMFYPCLYMFAIWDAFKDGGGGTAPMSFLPFLLSAYFGTVGIIYSPKMHLFGTLLGPVWLPMISAMVGIGIGVIVRMLVNRARE